MTSGPEFERYSFPLTFSDPIPLPQPEVRAKDIWGSFGKLGQFYEDIPLFVGQNGSTSRKKYFLRPRYLSRLLNLEGGLQYGTSTIQSILNLYEFKPK